MTTSGVEGFFTFPKGPWSRSLSDPLVLERASIRLPSKGYDQVLTVHRDTSTAALVEAGRKRDVKNLAMYLTFSILRLVVICEGLWITTTFSGRWNFAVVLGIAGAWSLVSSIHTTMTLRRSAQEFMRLARGGAQKRKKSCLAELTVPEVYGQDPNSLTPAKARKNFTAILETHDTQWPKTLAFITENGCEVPDTVDDWTPQDLDTLAAWFFNQVAEYAQERPEEAEFYVLQSRNEDTYRSY